MKSLVFLGKHIQCHLRNSCRPAFFMISLYMEKEERRWASLLFWWRSEKNGVFLRLGNLEPRCSLNSIKALYTVLLYLAPRNRWRCACLGCVQTWDFHVWLKSQPAIPSHQHGWQSWVPQVWYDPLACKSSPITIVYMVNVSKLLHSVSDSC